MNNKLLIPASVLIALVFVGAAVVAINTTPVPVNMTVDAPVVEMVGNKQIINMLARGGYQPKVITAKANIATTLRVETKNTFDCSASFTIPSLKISQTLPYSGITEFELPPQQVGSEMQGLCGMGMYGFTIKFIL